MKKYKVIRNYVDKYTKEMRYAGDVVELTLERAKELGKDGYIDTRGEKKTK